MKLKIRQRIHCRYCGKPRSGSLDTEGDVFYCDVCNGGTPLRLSRKGRVEPAPPEGAVASSHETDVLSGWGNAPYSRSRALEAARRKLGPDAHVRRNGILCEAGVFDGNGAFRVLGHGETFNRAIKEAGDYE